MKILKEFNTFIILSGAVTILFYLIPLFNFLIYPTILLLSVIQEIIHGLLGLVIKKKIFLLSMAESSEKSITTFMTIGKAFGAPFTILLGYICSKTNIGSRILIVTITVLFIITEILWSKNCYGFLVIGFFCIILLWLALSKNYRTTRLLLFFCSLQLNIALFFESNFIFTVFGKNISKDGNIQIGTNKLLLAPWMYTATYVSFLVIILSFGLRTAIKNNKGEKF